jgi:hypothetical protein
VGWRASDTRHGRVRRVKIAWGRHGAGPPVLLIHGLGYALGLEAVVEAARPHLRDDPVRQPQRRRGDAPRTPPPRWPPTPCRSSTRRGGAGARGRRKSGGNDRAGARAPPSGADRRLVLACTTPGSRRRSRCRRERSS